MSSIPRMLVYLTSASLALAPAPLRANETSPYGINAHLPSEAELDLVAEARIGWIRVDFNWFLMEPGRGVFSWETTDRVVDGARARGLEVFATLAYTPDWANGSAGIAVPPTDPADWYDFVFATVSRYRGRVRHWGMWNEPNHTQFFTGGLDAYINDILTVGSEAAKAADPDCRVLGPELAQLASAQWNWWLYNILSRAADRIDIVTHHMYDDTGFMVLRSLGAWWVPFWYTSTVRGIRALTGTTQKPLWLTETGWRTDRVTQTQQADYYEQVLNGVLGTEWLDKVFFYDLTDDPRFPEEWGILTANLTPKEAWFRYQSYIASHSERRSPRSSCQGERPGPRRSPC